MHAQHINLCMHLFPQWILSTELVILNDILKLLSKGKKWLGSVNQVINFFTFILSSFFSENSFSVFTGFPTLSTFNFFYGSGGTFGDVFPFFALTIWGIYRYYSVTLLNIYYILFHHWEFGGWISPPPPPLESTMGNYYVIFVCSLKCKILGSLWLRA